MRMHRSLAKAITLAVAAALFLTSWPVGVARAGLVSTEQVVEQKVAASERTRLTAVLLRDDVREQMAALGVDREEALARIASLSDAEVRQIAGQLEELPAGQGALEGALIVAGVILIALVITDLLGITNIFMFINPIR